MEAVETNNNALIIVAIIVPIVCTIIFGSFAWLWKLSIDKAIKTVDQHAMEIAEIKNRLGLAESNISHFEARERMLINTFKDEMAQRLDAMKELFEAKFNHLQTTISNANKGN